MVFRRSGLFLLLVIPVCLSQSLCFNDAQCPFGQSCQQVGNPSGGYSNRCVQRGSTSTCNSDSDCPQGSGCYNINGILTCQVTAGGLGSGGSNSGGSNGKICYSNSDCGFNEQCIYVNGANRCQLTAGGLGSGGNNDGKICYSNSDCGFNEQCIYVNGAKRCQLTAGGLGSGGNNDGKICYSNSDCGFNEQCIYVNGAKRCQITAGGLGNGGNSGGRQCTTINDCPIGQNCIYAGNGQSYCGNGAGTNNGQSCTQDYQCRQGEVCSAAQPGVSGRYCTYNVNAQRGCLFNRDCLSGEMCVYNAAQGKSVCQASAQSGNQQISCSYDFQCPGSEKCTSVNENGQQVKRCRNPNQADPSRNGPCNSNTDCPFGQTCQFQGSNNQCVDSQQNKIVFNALPNDGVSGNIEPLSNLKLKPEPRRRRAVMPIALTPEGQAPPPFLSPDFGGKSNNGNGNYIPRFGPFIRIGPPFARSAPLAQLLNSNEQH